VRAFLSGRSVFTQISRDYACALIVRSQAADPQHTVSMIIKEEQAQKHFEELKDALPVLSPHWWRKDFKAYVDKFIRERLEEKEFITVILCKGEEEEIDAIYLHGIQCLVAGAVQEWELVQQPKHAVTCAKLDGALVWQGRGYVSPILHAISLLQLSLQGEFENVLLTLRLVMPRSFDDYIFSSVLHS